MLKLYNTLTRKKEIFKPIKKNKIGFYQCGPTVYWTQHIGNMRAMTLVDFIIRALKYLDYDVKFVRNYTDVGHLTSDADAGEDKMEKAAKRESLSPSQIAEKYIRIFENDVKDLNTQEPNIKAKATEHIPDIIAMIQILMNKNFAYKTDLALYFDVSKAKDYTKLSRQNLEKQKYGLGSGEIGDPQKKHPSDFALWFFKTGQYKNALQAWKSPWGIGFPGWHIECSAISNKHLGKTFDIHMGGIEHIPIHHTNEIAQSESAHGIKFVNYWLHNEHLLVNNKKMAKSEGASYSLSEIKEKGFGPLALRYLFLQAHYRSKQNFTWKAMQSAQNGFQKLKSQISNLKFTVQNSKLINKKLINKDFKNQFIKKISDDFNFPQALVIVQKILKSDLPNKNKLATILDFDQVLGLKLTTEEKKQIPENVLSLVKQREQARKNKQWRQADEIREKIEKLGYKIEDTKDGVKINL
ncbi:MAG: cysteine--tRNA ligase [Patescibacteria group bacterium]